MDSQHNLFGIDSYTNSRKLWAKKIKLGHKICLTSSETLGSAPAFNKQLISSRLPLSAAICKGVAPPALKFTLAPACIQ